MNLKRTRGLKAKFDHPSLLNWSGDRKVENFTPCSSSPEKNLRAMGKLVIIG